jgi:Fe2+ transport system protein B
MIKKKIAIKLMKEPSRIRKEVRERTITYLVAAFSLVAGLAWNEAVKSLIDYFLPLSANTLLAKFIYAVLITVVVVTFTVYLEKIFKKEEAADS